MKIREDPLIIGLLCQKCLIKIRHRMPLHHVVHTSQMPTENDLIDKAPCEDAHGDKRK